MTTHKRITACLGTLTAICLMAGLISSCARGNDKADCNNYNRIINNDSIPQTVKNIVTALYENDPAKFAAEVGYPLQRPYPLKDIANEEEMKAYYNVMVDDSLRNVILDAAPDDWQRYGWRGYSVGDGSYLWVDEGIYAVDYVSARERELIDSLTSVERNSLPRKLADGWRPILTLYSADDGKIYRIDERIPSTGKSSSEYRLSIYNSSHKEDLSAMPSELLEGKLRIEGSAPVVSYVFPDKKGGEYVIYPDEPAVGAPTVTLPDSSEKELSKAYWYEMVAEGN